MHQPVRFALFGTPEITVTIAQALHGAGLTPAAVITRVDAPVGRGKVLTPPPMKVWAQSHHIPVHQPLKITPEFVAQMNQEPWDVFVVAAYGKILPQSLLDIPKHGTLNVHPSLLPRLRGPSPIRSAILENEKETGVSIMLLDAEMDHGPILAQEKVTLPEWPPRAYELEHLLATRGGEMLAETLPKWVAGEITATEQDHSKATFCRMLKKTDGLVDLNDDPYKNLLKIRALEGWPGAYTFFERNGTRLRVQLIEAHIENDALVLDTVKPEGKNVMKYSDFARSGATPAKDLTN